MEITGTHSEIDKECATMLKEASSVIIAGHGLAVAKAQYAVAGANC